MPAVKGRMRPKGDNKENEVGMRTVPSKGLVFSLGDSDSDTEREPDIVVSPKHDQRHDQSQKEKSTNSKDASLSKSALLNKISNLETKYRQLLEVSQNELEKNFEAYKRASEVRNKESDGLIKELREQLELEEGRRSTEDSEYMQRAKRAEREVESLKSKLVESRDRIKSLEETNQERERVDKIELERLRGDGDAQVLMVERLTGLKCCAVRNSGTVFDFTKTGNQGALNFTLELEKEEKIGYVPMIDPARDNHLLDILPDYLTENIEFTYDQACKFFERLSSCL